MGKTKLPNLGPGDKIGALGAAGALLVLGVALLTQGAGTEILQFVQKNRGWAAPIGSLIILIAGGLFFYVVHSITTDHQESFTKHASDVKFLFNEECEGLQASLKSDIGVLKAAKQEANDAVRAVKEVIEEVKQLRAGFTHLIDKVNDQSWYLDWEQFQEEETQLRRESQKAGAMVTAYIISPTLKFDTDDKLLPIVKENLKAGAAYCYIIPEHDPVVEERLDILKSAKINSQTSSTAAVERIEICRTSDGMLLGEIALFEYARETGNMTRQDYEAFMAVENGSARPPWIRLTKDKSAWLRRKVVTMMQQQKGVHLPH